jgi:hypothetical protein
MGKRVNAKTLKAQAVPALLAGAARQPLSFSGVLAELAECEPAIAALNTLSLTAQALRFERPLPPPAFNTEPEIHDDRPILPEAARRILIRLLKDRKTSDDLELALAWAFGRSRVRPHPFDLPRIDSFARTYAELLGLTAQHWAAQQEDTAAAPRSYFDAEALDDFTWSSAPLAQRVRFLVGRRKEDPATAKALLEAVWTQENADGRVRLLATLECGLSSGDQPFLEGILKDRAPRARSMAQRFLSRITGSSAEHPALKACLERIQLTSTGLIKKRAKLALELPATVKEHEVKAWIRSTFREVSFEELARALELTESAMIDAAEKDENLLLALAWTATADRRLDLVEMIAGGPLKDAWEQLSLCGNPNLSMMPGAERLRWAEILVRPYTSKPPASYAAWNWLHRALEGPVPELLMEPIVRSSRWLADLIDNPKAGEAKAGLEWMELLAAVCPPSQRSRLRDRFKDFDPTLTLTALPLLDILDSLEKAGHHE